MSKEDYAKIEEAAALENVPEADVMRDGSLKEAKRIIRKHEKDQRTQN